MVKKLTIKRVTHFAAMLDADITKIANTIHLIILLLCLGQPYLNF